MELCREKNIQNGKTNETFFFPPKTLIPVSFLYE